MPCYVKFIFYDFVSWIAIWRDLSTFC
uniref:Uncharacterized protein n=1 Tax=Rhizophora mucronata TaxID=61149 RepID=A0A2P2PGP1_RHIMU